MEDKGAGLEDGNHVCPTHLFVLEIHPIYIMYLRRIRLPTILTGKAEIVVPTKPLALHKLPSMHTSSILSAPNAGG